MSDQMTVDRALEWFDNHTLKTVPMPGSVLSAEVRRLREEQEKNDVALRQALAIADYADEVESRLRGVVEHRDVLKAKLARIAELPAKWRKKLSGESDDYLFCADELEEMIK